MWVLVEIFVYHSTLYLISLSKMIFIDPFFVYLKNWEIEDYFKQNNCQLALTWILNN